MMKAFRRFLARQIVKSIKVGEQKWQQTCISPFVRSTGRRSRSAGRAAGRGPPASGGNAVLRPAGAPDCGAESVQIHCHGVSEVTDKPFDKYSVRPKAPPRPIDTVSRSDRYETASDDSFPASDPPGWTVITGTGAPRSRSGPSRNEEPSS